MSDLKPCGTRAAYKRHLRRGEKPCDACRAAESVPRVRYKTTPASVLDARPAGRVRESELRDPVVPYRWRARRYAWAERVLAASEAQYGKPGEEAA